MVRTWYGHGAIFFCPNQDFQDLRIHGICLDKLRIRNCELRPASVPASAEKYKYNLIAIGVKYEAVGRRNMRENVETHGVRLRRAGKPAEMYRPFLRDATFGQRAPCVSAQSAVFPETVMFSFPRPKNQKDE
jgi:hypothetical protein